jgi:hypothetical protein
MLHPELSYSAQNMEGWRWDKHWGMGRRNRSLGDERSGSIFNRLREVIYLTPEAEQYTPVFLLGYHIT